MIIRKATKKDAESILKLERAWEDEDISWGLHIPKDRIDNIRKEIRKQIWFVAEDSEKEKIVGYIQGEIKKSERLRPSFNIKKGQKYGELHAVYLLKEYRGKHLGEKLVHKLLNHFKDNHIKAIILKAVSKDTIGLVEYYKKFGFQERHVDMVKEIK